MASFDGNTSGTTESGTDQASTATEAVNEKSTSGNKQAAETNGEQPIQMAQAEVAATNPNAPVTGIYQAPEGVELTDIAIQGVDLLITMPDGDVVRIEDAADQFSQVQIGELTFTLPFVRPEPAGDVVTNGSGGNFETDPGFIDPALPITPLLPPTALAFDFPQYEEIYLVEEDTEPEIRNADPTELDEDGLRWANKDSGTDYQPGGLEYDGNENLTDTGTILVDFFEDVPANPMDGIALDDLDSYDGQLTSGGVPVTFALDGDVLVGTIPGGEGSQEVIRIWISGATDNGDGTITYEYTSQLSLEVDHPSNDEEDSITLEGVQFTVTDSDGSTVTGTLDVGILDDIPEAFDDYFTQGDEYGQEESSQEPSVAQPIGNDFGNGENTPVTGDVLEANPGYSGTADIIGADHPGTVSLVVGSYNSTDPDGKGDVSHLTLNSDGTFTYTPGAGEQGTVTFDYTLTDDDGDKSTATVTIDLQDDSVPYYRFGNENGNLTVDEDGLLGANADGPISTETSNGNNDVATGTIYVDFGNDAPTDPADGIALNVAGLDGQLTSGNEAVVFIVETATGDIVGSTAGLGEVIRIAITDAQNTGSGHVEYDYTVTLSQPVDQAGNDNEDSIVLDNIQFTLTDGDDGDMATGSFDVTIYDDVPEAFNDYFYQAGDDENQNVTGNVLEENPSGSGTADVDSVDGAGTPHVQLVAGSYNSTDPDGKGDVSNLTLNADGTFTYNPSAGEQGTVTFNYELIDGDGDKSTATVTINLADDSTPEFEFDNDTGNLSVDEDGLVGANADGGLATESSNGNNAAATGTIHVDFGNDAPAVLMDGISLDDLPGYDSELTSGGDPVIFALDGDDLVGTIDSGATEVIRISITNATAGTATGLVDYEYTVTLSQPVDQGGNDSEDSIVLDNIQFTLTDGDDADKATGTFDVTIYDDVPDAQDDDFTQAQADENNNVTGNVLSDNGNGPDVDSIDGQDTPYVEFVAGSFNSTDSGVEGNLTLNADGSFTYNPGAGEEGTVTFDYMITDGDGDKSTATVTINLADDSTPEFEFDNETGNLSVDEDGLLGANADDGLVTETSNGNNAAATGTIHVDFGNDAPAVLMDGIALDDLPGYDLELTSGGDPVIFALDGDDLVGTIDSGATEVIRISITNATAGTATGLVDYEYTVTLSQPVDQAGNDNEDSIVLDNIQFTLTDGDDADKATGTFDVTIYDDVPDAQDDDFTQAQADENNNVTGNVLSDNGNGPDVDSIDGQDTPYVEFVAGSFNSTDSGVEGNLTLNADGSFTYNPGAGEEGTVTFDYTIEDGDGDLSTATVTITLQDDDEPSVEDTDTTVDEDGLSWANADTVLGTEDNFGGLRINTGSITVNYGDDVPSDLNAAIVLNDLGAYDLELESDSQPVVFALVGGDLVGTIDGGATEVIRISINDNPTNNGGGSYTYTYTVTLSQQVDHPANDAEDTVVLNGISYTVTDGDDGDTATGSFDVTIGDDVPNLLEGEELSITNNAPSSTSGSFTFQEGADTPGSVWFVGTNNTQAMDTDGNPISDGGPILLTGYGTDTLIGYVDNDDSGTYNAGDTVALTVTLDPVTDTWSAQIAVELDNGTKTDFDLVGGITGGNNSIQAVGADDDFNNNSNVDLLLDGDPGSVNTSNGRIGIGGGQSFVAGESVKIEFVTDAETAALPGDASGFDWAGVFETDTFYQELPRITGGSQLANFTVTALYTDNDDTLFGDLDDDPVEIVSAKIYDNGTEIWDSTSGDPLPAGVTVTFNGDGSVSFTGLEQDWAYEVHTADGDPFTGVQITGDTGTDRFTLGALTIGASSGGDPFDMDFNIAGADDDGDEITGTLSLTVEPDSVPTAATSDAEVDEDGFGSANADTPTGFETASSGMLSDTQTITVNFGTDFPGDINAAFVFDDSPALDGQLTTLDGNPVNFALESGDLVGRDSVTNDVVITIAVTGATDNLDGTVDYEYTVTLSEPVMHPGNDNEDSVTLSGITFTATDSNGDDVTRSFDVSIVDDVPSAEDDNFTQSADNADVTGNVLDDNDNGADVVGADNPGTVTLVGGTFNSTDIGVVGNLTLNPDGTFTYDPLPGEQGTVTFDYTLTDSDGDKSTATVTITLVTDAVPELEDTDTSVDEDGLAWANADTPTGLEADHGGNTTDTGTITVDFGTDVPGDLDAAIVLEATGLNTELDSGGQDVVFAVEGGTGDLVGTIDSGATEVIRIHIEDNPTANGGGSYTYDYTVTLSHEVDHPVNDNEDSVVLNGVGYTVTDSDGSTASGSVDVTIYDDVPFANDHDATQVAPPVDFNTVFIIDFSGSISNTELTTQMNAIKAAGVELFANAYGGDVSINLVGFAATAADLGTFTDQASFEAAVDALNPGEGGARPGTIGVYTDYTAAIEQTMASYVPDPSAQNLVFFLSDGEPNEQLGTGGNSLADATAALWQAFIDDNDLNVSTIGVGTPVGFDPARLLDVDLDDNPQAYLVGDFENLIDQLLALVQPTIAGNVFTNGSVWSDFGADGPGQIVSVTVDGVTYTWDGGVGDPQITPAPGVGTVVGSVLSVAVDVAGSTIDGTFIIDFATGDYSFQGPVAAAAETISYVVADNDGDEASASIIFDLTAPAVPGVTNIIVDEDGLGGANGDTALATEEDHGGLAVNTGTITFDFGSEVPGDLDAAIVLNDLGAYDSELESEGQPVVFALSGGDLVGTIDAGGTEVIRIHVEDGPTDEGGGLYTYEYTVTLSHQIDHPTNDGEDTVVLNGIEFSVTDDANVTSTGTLDITIGDDVPDALDGDELTIDNGSSGSTALSFVEGADGLGGVVFVGTNNTAATDAGGHALLSGGDAVLLTGFGTGTLTGYIDEDSSGTLNGGDTTVMTVELDPSGNNWNADFSATVEVSASTSVSQDVLDASFTTGSNNIFAVGANNGANNASNVDIIMEGDGVLEYDTGVISVDNSRIDTGEVVKMEFVTNAVTGGGASGFDWDSTYEATSFRQDVSYVRGGSGADVAEFIVAALSTDGDDDIYGDGNDTIVAITEALVYDENGVLIFQSSSTDTQSGVTVTFNANGTVTFDDIEEDWDFEVRTGSGNPFTGISVTGGSAHDFGLGAITIGTEGPGGETFDMSFDIAGTDGDGDEITDTLTLHVDEAVAPLAAIQSFSVGGGEGGGSGGSGGTGSGGTDGTGSGGPTGFAVDLTGHEDSLMTSLLGQSTGSFKDSAFVLEGPQIVHGIEEGANVNDFGGLVNELSGNDLQNASNFNGSGGMHGLSGTVDVDLADMLDQPDFDLSSLLGSGPETPSLASAPAESVETGFTNGISGLQLEDHMNYDHA